MIPVFHALHQLGFSCHLHLDPLSQTQCYHGVLIDVKTKHDKKTDFFLNLFQNFPEHPWEKEILPRLTGRMAPAVN